MEKWQNKSVKANADLHYQQMAQEHRSLPATPFPVLPEVEAETPVCQAGQRDSQTGSQGRKENRCHNGEAGGKSRRFVKRHPIGVLIAIGVFLVFMIFNSICPGSPMLGNGMLNAVMGTSYTAEDEGHFRGQRGLHRP